MTGRRRHERAGGRTNTLYPDPPTHGAAHKRPTDQETPPALRATHAFTYLPHVNHQSGPGQGHSTPKTLLHIQRREKRKAPGTHPVHTRPNWTYSPRARVSLQHEAVREKRNSKQHPWSTPLACERLHAAGSAVQCLQALAVAGLNGDERNENICA